MTKNIAPSAIADRRKTALCKRQSTSVLLLCAAAAGKDRFILCEDFAQTRDDGRSTSWNECNTPLIISDRRTRVCFGNNLFLIFMSSSVRGDRRGRTDDGRRKDGGPPRISLLDGGSGSGGGVGVSGSGISGSSTGSDSGTPEITHHTSRTHSSVGSVRVAGLSGERTRPAAERRVSPRTPSADKGATVRDRRQALNRPAPRCVYHPRSTRPVGPAARSVIWRHVAHVKRIKKSDQWSRCKASATGPPPSSGGA